MPTEAARVATEQAVARIENVRGTVNELAVMGMQPLQDGDAAWVQKDLELALAAVERGAGGWDGGAGGGERQGRGDGGSALSAAR